MEPHQRSQGTPESLPSHSTPTPQNVLRCVPKRISVPSRRWGTLRTGLPSVRRTRLASQDRRLHPGLVPGPRVTTPRATASETILTPQPDGHKTHVRLRPKQSSTRQILRATSLLCDVVIQLTGGASCKHVVRIFKFIPDLTQNAAKENTEL